MAQDTSDREIVNSRKLMHPVERIFEAFSDPDKLAVWWGPKGFKNTFHRFEFKPGGQWLFTMHSPDGRDFENESVFKAIIEPTGIVMEHICAPKFVLEISLTDIPGGTQLLWTQRFETAEMRDRVVRYAGNGNEENLDRLESVLASNNSLNPEQDV